MTKECDAPEDLVSCRCGGTGELIDNRLQFFVRCRECGHVVMGLGAWYIDQIGFDCETDEEADAVSAAAVDAIDWDVMRQSAITAWNAHK